MLITDKKETFYTKYYVILKSLVISLCIALNIYLTYFISKMILPDNLTVLEQSKLTIFFIILAISIIFASIFKLFYISWRLINLTNLKDLIIINTIAIIFLYPTIQLINSDNIAFVSYLLLWIIGNFLLLLLLSALGLLARRYYSTKDGFKTNITRRLVILGVPDEAIAIINAIKNQNTVNYNIIGFLTNDKTRHKSYIDKVKVLGPINKITELINNNEIDEAFVAVNDPDDNNIKPYIIECRKNGIPVKIMSNITNVVNGNNKPSIKDVSIEDLLRRPVQNLDLSDVITYITRKVVLVTGGGGSIGSELCRQISDANPKELIILGRGENSVYDIEQELKRTHPEVFKRIHCVICSMTDAKSINRIFNKYKPEIIFHAAAHKHVPLMEHNPVEAVSNNVFGTRNVVDAAIENGVKKFILISTDKAADPKSVMGATKWLCELILQQAAKKHKECDFISVRFGNVLGSRGSVVTLFKKQIAEGGPVTVTHPDMTRFFMTIPEAVTLVIKSGYYGKSGDLFILDMGKPVKINDLAEDLILLSGLTPNKEIEIKYTGLREAEKMHEKLSTNLESFKPYHVEGINIVKRPDYYNSEEYEGVINKLSDLVNTGDDDKAREILGDIIPGFIDDDRE